MKGGDRATPWAGPAWERGTKLSGRRGADRCQGSEARHRGARGSGSSMGAWCQHRGTGTAERRGDGMISGRRPDEMDGGVSWHGLQVTITRMTGK